MPQAITATAHKLARIIYAMLWYGQEYVDAGAEYYERQYQHRALPGAGRRNWATGWCPYPMVSTRIAACLSTRRRPPSEKPG